MYGPFNPENIPGILFYYSFERESRRKIPVGLAAARQEYHMNFKQCLWRGEAGFVASFQDTT
jgi:hypothetical protein